MNPLFCLLIPTLISTVEPVHRDVVVSGGGHFPVLIEMQNNDLLGVVRGGAPHRGRGGRLDLVRSSDGGRTWSGPEQLVDGPEDDRNPALGQLADGTLLAAYAVLSWPPGSESSAPDAPRPFNDGLRIMRSTDEGRTWSEPERIEGVDRLKQEIGCRGSSPYGKIIQTSDGVVLMAVYVAFHDERGHRSYLFRSTDQGRTWGDPTLMGEHFNETGIAVLESGRIVAAMRSEVGRYVVVRNSDDGGRTWGDPVRVTADQEHPADLIQLADGRVLMTYGQRSTPRGVEARWSNDGGETWNDGDEVVLVNDVRYGDNGYPSSVETEPGLITTLYYQVDHPKGALEGAKTQVIQWRTPDPSAP